MVYRRRRVHDALSGPHLDTLTNRADARARGATHVGTGRPRPRPSPIGRRVGPAIQTHPTERRRSARLSQARRGGSSTLGNGLEVRGRIDRRGRTKSPSTLRAALIDIDVRLRAEEAGEVDPQGSGEVLQLVHEVRICFPVEAPSAARITPVADAPGAVSRGCVAFASRPCRDLTGVAGARRSPGSPLLRTA